MVQSDLIVGVSAASFSSNSIGNLYFGNDRLVDITQYLE